MILNKVRFRFKAIGIAAVMSVLVFAGQQVNANLDPENKDEMTASGRHKFSEADNYIDLNTGKSFKVIYDQLNEIYNRSDLFAFDLYVNERTKDTMWLDEAIVVNNALVKDADGRYRIDGAKVKRDGDSYKVKTGR
jgi:hypothetical protein